MHTKKPRIALFFIVPKLLHQHTVGNNAVGVLDKSASISNSVRVRRPPPPSRRPASGKIQRQISGTEFGGTTLDQPSATCSILAKLAGLERLVR